MNKVIFNKMEIEKQVKYINNELLKGCSLKNISLSLGISKSTIKERFFKIGFIFDLDKRQYIKHKENINVMQNENIKFIEQSNKAKKNNKVLHYKYNDEYNFDKDKFNDKNINKKVFEIVNKYENILEMLEWFNKQKNIIEPMELKIDNSKLSGEVKTTTIRIYIDIWNNFKSFSDDFKEYKIMDLISMALIEFMEKYKK